MFDLADARIAVARLYEWCEAEYGCNHTLSVEGAYRLMRALTIEDRSPPAALLAAQRFVREQAAGSASSLEAGPSRPPIHAPR